MGELLTSTAEDLGETGYDFDHGHGLIEVDPRDHTYTVLADAAAVERVRGDSRIRGPYSNPKIQPFGPPPDDAGEVG